MVSRWLRRSRITTNEPAADLIWHGRSDTNSHLHDSSALAGHPGRSRARWDGRYSIHDAPSSTCHQYSGPTYPTRLDAGRTYWRNYSKYLSFVGRSAGRALDALRKSPAAGMRRHRHSSLLPQACDGTAGDPPVMPVEAATALLGHAHARFVRWISDGGPSSSLIRTPARHHADPGDGDVDGGLRLPEVEGHHAQGGAHL